MTDCHIHIEQGPYTLPWIEKFVQAAVLAGLEDIRLLEHSYLFPEFLPMYEPMRPRNTYIDRWLERKGGKRSFPDFMQLCAYVHDNEYPIKIKLGLEVCYFPGTEDLVYDLTRDTELDFLVGSAHFIGNFAFDHQPEHWQGQNIDALYHSYFQQEIQLARCGLFQGLAHPDLIGLFGHRPSFSLNKYYEELAAALQHSNMYAEQNGGAFRRCPATARPGMHPDLVAALQKYGVPILTASDAHCPEDVGKDIRLLEALLVR